MENEEEEEEEEEKEEEEKEEEEEEEKEEEGRGKGSSCAFLVWASSLNGPPPGVVFFLIEFTARANTKKPTGPVGFFLYCGPQ